MERIIQQSVQRARIRANGKISVVIPVYRAEQSLPLLVPRLISTLQSMQRHFEIILVDDSSPDSSWQVLKRLKQQHPSVLRLARLLTNSGQHNAILCGLSLVTGDVVVTMDDDLQNPPEELPKMVAAVDRGFDLAIGAYDSKKHAGARNAAGRFIDWLLRRIFHLPRDFQLTSFRAFRRVVADNVCQMGGVFPYITSMVFSHASKYVNVSVRHDPRAFGSSNYTLRRSVKLAVNLILNYSSYPLYAVASLCLFAFVVSAGLGSFIAFRSLIHGSTVPGWASTMVAISFFNALVLLCLLIYGLYLSRINEQISRRRVSYTIEELDE
jgi:polyisoprenyl-phosphate glycosyltransferase